MQFSGIKIKCEKNVVTLHVKSRAVEKSRADCCHNNNHHVNETYTQTYLLITDTPPSLAARAEQDLASQPASSLLTSSEAQIQSLTTPSPAEGHFKSGRVEWEQQENRLATTLAPFPQAYPPSRTPSWVSLVYGSRFGENSPFQVCASASMMIRT